MPLSFLAIKLLRLVITVWATMTFVFVVMRASGDPLLALVPPDLPDAVLAEYRERLGLEGSVIAQYGRYVANILQGEFGLSFRTQGPAWELVASRLPPTLLLGGSALLLALGIGVPLGLIAALRRDRWPDRAAMAFAVFGFAMPNFFFGILLILLFTLTLEWLPSAGMGSPAHLVMPAVTLGLAAAGLYARFVRSALLEVLEMPYLRTARAKGLGFARVLLVHALPNASLPLLTVLGFSVGTLIAGAVVTETVFAWPGVGRLMVISVGERDLAVVQLLVILIAVTISLVNLAIDLLYAVIDPRLRHGEGR